MMKKLFTGALIAALMTLSACSSGVMGGAPDIDKVFSAEARIAVGGETVSGQLSRTADNCWTFSVSEPYALEGLSVKFENGETIFSMLGFECTADFSDSAVSALKLLAEAYETAVDNAGGFENGILEYTNENGSFSLTLDENGKPAVLTAGGISVQLSGWSENIVTENESDELILIE